MPHPRKDAAAQLDRMLERIGAMAAQLDHLTRRMNTLDRKGAAKALPPAVPVARSSEARRDRPSPPSRIYRFPDLRSAGVPFTRKHITTLEQRAEFPQHFYLTPYSVAWVAQEIDDWVANAIHHRRRADADVRRRVVAAEPVPELQRYRRHGRARGSRTIDRPRVLAVAAEEPPR